MKTKKEKIAEAKIMLEAMGLIPQDLLEEESSQDAPKFLDIKMINNIPFMYIRYNNEIQKHEWLCLEIPNEPQMSWKEGRRWCQSKGGDYGEIPTLEFISVQREKINQVLEANGYPKIEVCWHWSSTEYDNSYSWKLNMSNGNSNGNYKNDTYYVRAIVLS